MTVAAQKKRINWSSSKRDRDGKIEKSSLGPSLLLCYSFITTPSFIPATCFAALRSKRDVQRCKYISSKTNVGEGRETRAWWLPSFDAVTAFTRWETTDEKRFANWGSILTYRQVPHRQFEWKMPWILFPPPILFVSTYKRPSRMEIVSAFGKRVTSSALKLAEPQLDESTSS